jgi:prepilin-type N-terminal cleavage/methylation domain-containing protein
MVISDDGASGIFADNDIVRTDCDRTKIPSQSPEPYQGEIMIQRLKVKRNEKGFTLIELLIVIIVLGILAAIVVFAVGNTRSDAVESSCKTNFKAVELSAEAVNTKMGRFGPLADLSNPDNGGLFRAGGYPTSTDYTLTYAPSAADTLPDPDVPAGRTYTITVAGAGGTTLAGGTTSAGCKKA